MKKKMFISLIMMTLLSLVFVMAIQAQDTEILEGYHIDGNPFSQDFLENQNDALALYRMMRGSFGQTRSGETIYPSNYAGSFINSEGNLTINIVGSDRDLSGSLSLFSRASSANVRYVNFSYDELHHTLNYLNEYWANNPDCVFRNSMTYQFIDTIGNRVVVGLYGYSEGLEAEFRHHVLDSPMMEFEEGVHQVSWIEIIYNLDDEQTTYSEDIYHDITPAIEPRSITITPGSRIYVASGNVTFSMSAGYGVLRGAQRGFLTSPHGGLAAGNEVRAVSNRNSPLLGRLTNPIVFSGRVDAVMIALEGQFINNVNGLPLSRTPVLPVIGQTLHSIGSVTGMRSNISVTSLTFSVGPLTNIVRTNGIGQHGDSGGLVWENRTDLRVALVAGLISGGDANGRNMFFTRAMDINGSLGVGIQ